MSDWVIDAFGFCRNGERREGDVPVAELGRLATETVGHAGVLRWALQGGRDPRGNPRLQLTIAGTVNLLCQRCLTPLEYTIDSSSALVLASDERSADEIEEMLSDEEVEVIVGSSSMNLLELIEDEALLALPLSPRHEACGGAVLPAEPGMAEKPSPFAVLKKLKH